MFKLTSHHFGEVGCIDEASTASRDQDSADMTQQRFPWSVQDFALPSASLHGMNDSRNLSDIFADMRQCVVWSKACLVYCPGKPRRDRVLGQEDCSQFETCLHDIAWGLCNLMCLYVCILYNYDYNWSERGAVWTTSLLEGNRFIIFIAIESIGPEATTSSADDPIVSRKVETLYLDAIHKNTAPALVNTAAETKARINHSKSLENTWGTPARARIKTSTSIQSKLDRRTKYIHWYVYMYVHIQMRMQPHRFEWINHVCK